MSNEQNVNAAAESQPELREVLRAASEFCSGARSQVRPVSTSLLYSQAGLVKELSESLSHEDD